MKKPYREQAENRGTIIIDESGIMKVQRKGHNDKTDLMETLEEAPIFKCLDLDETLSTCENPLEILGNLEDYCKRSGAELVFSMPNAFFEDRIVEQYALDSIPSAKRAMTISAIQKMVEHCHFRILSIQKEYAAGERISELRSTEPDLAEKIDFFSDLTVDRNNIKSYVIRCGYKEEEPKKKNPFLSIIIRTKGDRLQELKEVLLCLNAQTIQDFEVLIMMHNLAEEKISELKSIQAYIPEPLRCRYRFIPVHGGTRAVPLNAAIDEVRGSYFSILDDDDLILANWVEAFSEGARIAPGKIIHTYAVTQEWSRHDKDLRSESEKDNLYCSPFNWDLQYRTNRCPFMTLAFPTQRVRRMKYRFDETLNTVEDWDFLMKVATQTDVYDETQCTAIYRKWSNAENSTTLFNEKQRKKTEKEVRKKFNQLLRITRVEAGPADKEEASPEDVERKDHEDGEKLEPEIRLEEQVHYADIFTWNGEKIVIRFDKPFNVNETGKVRIDPFIYGGFLLRSLSIYVYYENGEVEKYEGKQIKTNGLTRGDTIYFFFSDPQIFIDIPKKKMPSSIEVMCSRSNELLSRSGIKLLPLVYLKLIKQIFTFFFRKVKSKFVN